MHRIPACIDAEETNLAAAAWLDQGRELALVAQVPPHSNCTNMGQVTGFRVSVPSGRVLETVAQEDVRRRWGELLGFGVLPSQAVAQWP